ncbi:major strawberry allergen Fra a 1.05-like [Mercurialis annua]|uniref:major strawberry allergen Fra a 1.05-like n=1 Tax=Mercurialis annua TaxID=3986 RepID=UPI002160506B|nr:major strawberry allergen Fra a 1.05-like [Mercurialis annua]
MGVVSYEMVVSSSIPAAKLYKALILEGDTLIPKILPQAVKSVQILEGDGGPGTIKLVTFGEGSQFKNAKHKVDAMDKDKLIFNHSVIEGDMLANVIEKISYETKFEQSSDGGCICKESSKYYTIGNFELTQDQLKAGKEKALGIFKAIEAYLLVNCFKNYKF